MADEKERFEVLLEEIRDDIKRLAEGQMAMVNRTDRLEQSILQLSQAVVELRMELRRIADRLVAHEQLHAGK